ncbi:Two-component response regulator, AmiR/NasT family, consists of REC and RNA-binding antiterminator (ANTAR) domains [Loktanella atrilutea]|uniref:Two-component response regulator, AmiR/NasT family, consists of REC and RNA-binding antiterminator (ANTAR) domains n=1 Tax=Loktanella atrilutea TaxID=366533 RepID=A0A1M4SQM9_LOKAT|nr:ANTAR domain-containing protein [Loktanella atrilutea]SHE34489.1 Two-component response regulator, AmiR/NasT family, consists of REC and RNA-binding antiterminator (ANTAR) domains [Loktanella atrilutea]
MSRGVEGGDLGGARAIVLHRPHAVVASVTRQLQAIGLSVESAWPDLPADAASADFLFFDADMGFDAQFPWQPGAAPLPLIALIGSEAPGRIEWALSAGAQAQILKPVGDGGVYSALLIARHGFAMRQTLTAAVDDMRGRLGARQTVVRAIVQLTRGAGSEDAAYDALRRMAMDGRITLEEAAARVVATPAVDRRARKGTA